MNENVTTKIINCTYSCYMLLAHIKSYIWHFKLTIAKCAHSIFRITKRNFQLVIRSYMIILCPAACSPFTLDGKHENKNLKKDLRSFTFSLNARLEAPPSPRKSSRRSCSPKSGVLLPSIPEFSTNRCLKVHRPAVPTDSEHGNVQVWSHVNIGP